jgi:hypothetical protein
MGVTERFASARELWMSRYVEALRTYRAKYQPGGPEVLLQLSDNGEAAPFRLYRVDLASGATSPPNFTEVNLESVAGFQPERLELPSGLIVTIEPFHWNGVEFTVQGLSTDFAPIADWCLRWLDAAESNPPDRHGLLGAIHSVTAPEIRDDGVMFSVDFGSAPVDAAQSLLDLLASLGATTVSIGSTWARET